MCRLFVPRLQSGISCDRRRRSEDHRKRPGIRNTARRVNRPFPRLSLLDVCVNTRSAETDTESPVGFPTLKNGPVARRPTGSRHNAQQFLRISLVSYGFRNGATVKTKRSAIYLSLRLVFLYDRFHGMHFHCEWQDENMGFKAVDSTSFEYDGFGFWRDTNKSRGIVETVSGRMEGGIGDVYTVEIYVARRFKGPRRCLPRGGFAFEEPTVCAKGGGHPVKLP
ncbi:hypothetical protein KM043_016837 [Ampulex compressa]|nr:hypothetical protein KM043_016837 [Ampulex compressa]